MKNIRYHRKSQVIDCNQSSDKKTTDRRLTGTEVEPQVEIQTVNIERFLVSDKDESSDGKSKSNYLRSTDFLKSRINELEQALKEEILLRESIDVENDLLKTELANTIRNRSLESPDEHAGRQARSASYVRLHGLSQRKASDNENEDKADRHANKALRSAMEEAKEACLRNNALEDEVDQLKARLQASELRCSKVDGLVEELVSKNEQLMAESEELEKKIREHIVLDKQEDFNIRQLIDTIDRLKLENEDLHSRLRQRQDIEADGRIEKANEELRKKDEAIASLKSRLLLAEDELPAVSMSTSPSEFQRLLQGIHQMLVSTLETVTKGSILGRIKPTSNRHSSMQILLLELKTVVTSIASETSLLVQREANQSKKIKMFEENHEKMLTNLENLERELKTYKAKEKDYLTKLEQMEADLARLETLTQSDQGYSISPEMISYLEDKLQLQTSVAQIYRGLLEKVLEILPDKMSSLVSDLAQNLIDQATMAIDQQFADVPPTDSHSDFENEANMLHHEQQAANDYLVNQSLLRSQMEDLERQLNAMLHNSKITFRLLTENQRKSETIDMEAMRLTRPKSSYLNKAIDEIRPSTPVSEQYYRSEQFHESKSDFALLKSKLQEIKSKLI